MLIELDRTGDVEQFNNLLYKVSSDPSVNSILILACDGNNYTPASVDPGLTKICKPVFGGIFPEIVFGKEKLTKGCIVGGLNKEANVHIVSKLSDPEADYEQIIADDNPDVMSTKTMFVLVDGLSKRIASLIDSLFNNFGLEFNYIGGGAGSLNFVQKPCLFTNNGLIQDSALLVMLDVVSGIGVSHGWGEVSGPYKVTEADRNIIKSLDWQPAFEVYSKVIENESDKVFNDNNFFELAKSFPFGINKLGAEKVVRDPLMLGEDNSLVCVGEVPEESYVHILTGDSNSLVNAAKSALAIGEDNFPENDGEETTLFIDCISRVLFLEKQFSRELEAVSKSSRPLIGALTLGEIANSGKDYLEFYNKTSVVGVIGA